MKRADYCPLSMPRSIMTGTEYLTSYLMRPRRSSGIDTSEIERFYAQWPGCWAVEAPCRAVRRSLHGERVTPDAGKLVARALRLTKTPREPVGILNASDQCREIQEVLSQDYPLGALHEQSLFRLVYPTLLHRAQDPMLAETPSFSSEKSSLAAGRGGV